MSGEKSVEADGVVRGSQPAFTLFFLSKHSMCGKSSHVENKETGVFICGLEQLFPNLPRGASDLVEKNF